MIIDTNVSRFTTTDSNYNKQYKLASFDCLINRLLTFPLSIKLFNKKLATVKKIAFRNSNSIETLRDILKKYLYRQNI